MTTTLRQSGLTLIELMVTISIAAIVLTLSVPGFQSVSAKMQRSAAVTSVTGSIYYARSEAMKRGVVLTLCASDGGTDCRSGSPPDWNAGWILFEDADQDRQVDSGEEILRARSVENPLYSLTGDSNLAQGITFATTGFPKTSGQLSYTETGAASPCIGALALNVVGRVKVSFNHDHCSW